MDRLAESIYEFEAKILRRKQAYAASAKDPTHWKVFHQSRQHHLQLLPCHLLPHAIPVPGALLAMRVTPAMLTDRRLPSHYAIRRSPKAGFRGLLQRMLQIGANNYPKSLNFR